MTGAIVAGGAAARFGGAPKGLERVGGIRIIDRVASALRATTSDLLMISNARDAAEWLPGVPTFGDVRAERGSLVGIHSALAHARGVVLVVAWDMPFVSSALLHMIRDRGRDAEFAVIPSGPSGPEPFCALYTPSCLPVIEAAIDAGDLRLSHTIAQLPRVEYIALADIQSVGDPGTLFFNVNSAEDLAVAEQMNPAR